ncbi:MAG TPA: rhomboid family intramembrane serine protease [Marinilabiliales bacterium]|nr:MAG: rhomboid family intramembrane serine protease [Bacteroidetes bacterium GWA2_40_14]OFX74034.1 MAG: rhomboid family intramembrane serine protease [Bacteroidetes bacterium GWD2_40_43]OFX93131.1 MAG: rhomboid family intramembrane serine protease [Bacteroidetes bacterium GWE2_40_63]OFY21501.1 MAG: rhomboid family intramembrane serine protease [Bacteroidetes bacterium GWF2_40_13]OFZ24155.1 MAG: rhomboid family intramembrane serine protease [Bacteroidetes bacterium RIFOXYC2_FULL_40_12]HAM9810
MITLLIVIGTAVFSIVAFNQPELMYKYNFNAYQVIHRKQWYRLFTHAFLHANWEHLIINMLVLYSFGQALEYYFYAYIGENIIGLYLLVYFGAIVASSIASLIKEKDNYHYNAVGASGAVSAITFACIFFEPTHKILFMAFIPIPGIVFGILYLVYSWYMGKRNADNIGHDAHFWGAVFGFIFPTLIKPELLISFFEKLMP